jgi:protein HOOK3
LDELGDVEEMNRGLRDQLDEVRHEMERARKLENVIEKYKKKLDESADLRRQMKVGFIMFYTLKLLPDDCLR